MEPTKLYVKSILKLKDTIQIKGMAHITGGGLLENIPRVMPDGVGVSLDLSAIPVPPVFQWLAKAGGVAERVRASTWAVVVAPTLAAFLFSADTISIQIANPRIGEGLHAGLDGLQCLQGCHQAAA